MLGAGALEVAAPLPATSDFSPAVSAFASVSASAEARIVLSALCNSSIRFWSASICCSTAGLSSGFGAVAEAGVDPLSAAEVGSFALVSDEDAFVAAFCANPEIGAQLMSRESVITFLSVFFIFTSCFLLRIRRMFVAGAEILLRIHH